MLSADLFVQYNADLSATWSSVVVGASDSGPDADGVTVEVDDSSSPHHVTVTIPSANEESGRLFSRLAVQPK